MLDIAARGLGYGIHLVLTASRSMEVRANLKDHLMNRLELRLGDTMDSELDRKVAANVPTGVPGRGLIAGEAALHGGGAADRRPQLGQDLSEATAALTAGGRPGTGRRPAPPPCGCCRASCAADRLPAGSLHPDRGVSFGIDEDNLEPVFVDFEQDPFFLVFGESESGKSNLLRLLIKRLTERYDGDSCKLFVVDNRRAPAGRDPAHAPGGVRPHVEQHGAPRGRARRPDAAPYADGGGDGAAAAGPQLVARAERLRDRRRLRPGVHVERQPALGPDRTAAVRAGRRRPLHHRPHLGGRRAGPRTSRSCSG